MTYQQWLADAAQALNQVNPTENGKVDALVLLQHATGKSRTQILAFDETEIDEKVRLKLTALLAIFKALEQPIIGRVEKGKIWLDLRSVADFKALLDTVEKL